MSKGKYHSLPLSTSGIYYSNDMHEGLLKNDFPEFSGDLNIEEFFQWLFEVKRFFEYRDISDKKKVKFVAHKLKKSAWEWWEQLQRMRTRLGKDPIQNWEKMKKYLKRQFLPPDYKDLVYQEYLNYKQLGNSIATYTKKFYRLQSYLDFNVLEEYSISRYKNGLCWAIRERLSSQSFYYLFDLVLAAEAIEQLLEREKTMKWKPQTLQHTTTDDVKYPSFIVSGGQREYNSIIQSNRVAFDFVDVIKDKDHVSKQPEGEPKQHSGVSTGYIINSNVCFNSIHDKLGEDMVVRKEDCLSQIKEAGGIFEPKEIKSNTASPTSVITDRLPELITEFPTTMKVGDHQSKLLLVLTLPYVLNSCIIQREKSNQPRQVYLLPNAFSADSIVGKSRSLSPKTVSAMAQYYENWRMFNWFPEIMHNNVYHEMCITKGSKRETGYRQVVEYCELQAMCTNHSNLLGINLFTCKTRKLHISLKQYFSKIGTVPRSQDLLKTTIPCSGISHFNICESMTRILLGQGDDWVSLQLINHTISIPTLPMLVIKKEKRSWRICIGNQAVKIISKLRFASYWRGIYGRLQIYFGMNLRSSAQWISNEKAIKYETEFKAIAKIYQLLDFPMKPHIDWTKCQFMGENMGYLHFIVDANHIIAKEETITTIQDLTTPRNILQEGSYQGLAWFYIPCIVTPKAMLIILIDFTVRRDVYTTRVEALLLQACMHNNMEEIKWWRERGKGVTTNDRWKCKEQISNATYRKLAKIEYNLQYISVCNLGTFDIFNIIHPYKLTENEENSRTSSFEEGAPDVGQNVAQEPIFYYSGQVLIGGPFKALWALGESLGPDTFFRQSPRDHKHL